MSKNRYLNIFANGIVKENPTFRLVLGMCPTLAVTTSMFNGLGMGLATTFVLFFSNMIISLLKKIIPEKVRIPAYIVVIASFVTIVEMVMSKFLPDLYDSLGVFISLIVVNCIIFARAEAFAFKNPPVASMADGLGMGLGFTLAITLLSSIRELLGNGTIFGVSVLGASFQPMAIMTAPPGGFIALGILLAIVNAFTNRKKKTA